MKYSMTAKDVDEAKTAKAAGVSLDISWKHSKMVCNFIRGMYAEDAVELLEAVIRKEVAVPYPEYHRDLSHKTKIGPARYPVKTAKRILFVLKGAISNAQHKNLDTNALVIKHIAAMQADRPWHAGRHARRMAKRSHLQIILEQQEPKARPARKEAKKETKKEPAKEAKPQAKKSPAKTEAKPEQKPEAKAEPKAEGKPTSKPAPKAAEKKPVNGKTNGNDAEKQKGADEK